MALSDQFPGLNCSFPSATCFFPSFFCNILFHDTSVQIQNLNSYQVIQFYFWCSFLPASPSPFVKNLVSQTLSFKHYQVGRYTYIYRIWKVCDFPSPQHPQKHYPALNTLMTVLIDVSFSFLMKSQCSFFYLLQKLGYSVTPYICKAENFLLLPRDTSFPRYCSCLAKM